MVAANKETTTMKLKNSTMLVMDDGRAIEPGAKVYSRQNGYLGRFVRVGPERGYRRHR